MSCRYLLPLVAVLPLAGQEAPTFSRDVAPIFAKYCIGCHASSGSKMGGLEVETWEGLQKGGAKGPVIVPGKSQESRLYLMMSGAMKPVMPMGGQMAAAGELEVIKRWIDAGAKAPAAGEVAVKPAAAPKIAPRVAVKPQVFSLAYSPSGNLLAIGGWKEVRLQDPATLKDIARLPEHADVVRAVAFSKDGKYLAAAGGAPGKRGEVLIWDVAAKTKVATISGHSDSIYSAAFSPDGKIIATSSYDKLVKLWDAASGKELRTLKDHIDAVYALAFFPDGKLLISGAADRTLKVWDAATGTRLFTLGEPTDGINALVLDPSGKMVAAAGLDKSIRIWALDARAGRLARSQIAHEDAILRLAWSPDGKLLASSSADKTVKIFRASDLTELHSIPAQSDWVYGLEFSPDGKSFAVGRYDGSVNIYETEKFRDSADLRTASR